MSTETIYQEISKLTNSDKIIILKKLITEISSNLEASDISFFDIQGVGKELWKGIDAQEYVNNERESWT